MDKDISNAGMEMDMSQVVATFWRGKWWIMGSTAIALALGVAYVVSAPARYEVQSKVGVNLYALNRQISCAAVNATLGVDCFERDTLEIGRNALGPDWEITAGKIAKRKNADPASLDLYTQELQSARAATNAAMLDAANLSLRIDTEVDRYIIEQTKDFENIEMPIIGENRRGPLLLIARLEAGENAITFAEPEVVKTAPKTNVILAASFLLGAIIGTIIVALRAFPTTKKTI